MLAAGTDGNDLIFWGNCFNFNRVLPGNETVFFFFFFFCVCFFFCFFCVCVCGGEGGAFFCNIQQCKLYLNDLHKHAPSIKYIYVFFSLFS